MTAMSCKKYQRKVTYSTRITKSGVYHPETGLITWTITVTNPDFHEYSAVSLTSTTKNDLIFFDCLFYLEAGAKRIFAIRFAACLIWLKIKMSQKPAERDDKNVRRGNL